MEYTLINIPDYGEVDESYFGVRRVRGKRGRGGKLRYFEKGWKSKFS